MGTDKIDKKTIRKLKKVWCFGYLWKVEQVLEPTKYDTYLLVSRKCDTTMHDDGIIPTIMAVIDLHNDEFYPDSKEVLKLMKKQNNIEKESKSIEKRLSTIWLDTMGYHC